MAKVKATMPDFQTEPNFGDPFTSDDIKEFAASLEEADTENEEDADEAAKEELEQVKLRPKKFEKISLLFLTLLKAS